MGSIGWTPDCSALLRRPGPAPRDHAAVAKATDTDQPRNLAKSVTVECREK
jgi:hypothetical protein